ncbi:MAG: hypothetical protein KF715_07540 [Candidatus Didemnitutus sp.]|nr:hypothetical protein [Candidatus Didemnitutus sp.]
MAENHSTPTPVYRKLTPLKRGFGTLSQLCLGPDHLLHLTSTGYSETYRRFYLRDIQAMLIVHTARRVIYASVFVVVGLLALMIVHAADGGAVGMGIVGGVVVALLAWNHVRGAGCRVVVITAVQQENVNALCRLPRTRKVLAEIQPLIEAAQADLAEANAVEAAAPGETGGASAASPSSLPPPLPPPLPS